MARQVLISIIEAAAENYNKIEYIVGKIMGADEAERRREEEEEKKKILETMETVEHKEETVQPKESTFNFFRRRLKENSNNEMMMKIKIEMMNIKIENDDLIRIRRRVEPVRRPRIMVEPLSLLPPPLEGRLCYRRFIGED